MDASNAKNETDDVPLNDNTVDGVTISGGQVRDKLRELAEKLLNADKNNDPAPDPNPPSPKVPQPSWLVWGKRAVWALGWALAIAASFMYYRETGKVVIPDGPVFPGSTVQSEDGTTYGQGWDYDPEAIKESHDRFPVIQFSDTPAGKAVQGDVDDVFLWRSVRKATGRNELDSWYPNINQQWLGMCVGCGWKHAIDVVLAQQVTSGRAQKWEPVSAEAIYGGSRVQIGGGRIRGDGSVGAWAREFVRTRGVVPMRKYDTVDLSSLDLNRAKLWGDRGVPADIENLSRENPVQGTALVTTWVDIKKAITQGYCIAVCSNVGFNNANGTTGTRDKDGIIRPRGTWAHCMMFCGYRSLNGSEYVFCLNSWGDTAHGGPVYPADAPRAGFWIESSVAERMVSQRDSYAVADVAGFPARKIDWFTKAQPAVDFNKIKNFDFALAP